MTQNTALSENKMQLLDAFNMRQLLRCLEITFPGGMVVSFKYATE